MQQTDFDQHYIDVQKLLRTEVIVGRNEVYPDERGYFQELFDHAEMQVNTSFSRKGTWRGLHIQPMLPQAKFLTVVSGSIRDFFIDLRQVGNTKWQSMGLSAGGSNKIYIPKGYAHGFLALEDSQVVYVCDAPRDKHCEVSIKIEGLLEGAVTNKYLPLGCDPVISERDKKGISLEEYYKTYGRLCVKSSHNWIQRATGTDLDGASA